MRRIVNFREYRVNENSNNSQNLIELNWVIGENDCEKTTQYVAGDDLDKVKSLLAAVEGCDAKYIIGSKIEGILENDIELSDEKLKIYKEMVEDLKLSGLSGDCMSKIEEGEFSLDDFNFKK